MNEVERARLTLALRSLAQTIGLDGDGPYREKVFGDKLLTFWTDNLLNGQWFAHIYHADGARLATLQVDAYETADQALSALLQELFRYAVEISVKAQIAIAVKIGELRDATIRDAREAEEFKKAVAAEAKVGEAPPDIDWGKAFEEAQARIDKWKARYRFDENEGWVDYAQAPAAVAGGGRYGVIGNPEVPEVVAGEAEDKVERDFMPEEERLLLRIELAKIAHPISTRMFCNARFGQPDHTDAYIDTLNEPFARVIRNGRDDLIFDSRNYETAYDALEELFVTLAEKYDGFDKLADAIRQSLHNLDQLRGHDHDHDHDDEPEGDHMARNNMSAVERAKLAEAITAIAGNAGWAWEAGTGHTILQFESSAVGGMFEPGMWFANITYPGKAGVALYVGDYASCDQALAAVLKETDKLNGPYVSDVTKKLFVDSIASYLNSGSAAGNPQENKKMNQPERFNPLQNEEARDYSLKDAVLFGAELAESALITRGADAALRKALPDEFVKQLEGSEFMNHAVKFLTRLGIMYGANFAKKKWEPAGHIEKVGFLASAIETQQTADAIADRVVPFLFLFFKNFLADRGVQQVLEGAGIPAEAIPEVDQETVGGIVRAGFEEIRKNALANSQAQAAGRGM